jgi:hypothetical protein
VDIDNIDDWELLEYFFSKYASSVGVAAKDRGNSGD